MKGTEELIGLFKILYQKIGENEGREQNIGIYSTKGKTIEEYKFWRGNNITR